MTQCDCGKDDDDLDIEHCEICGRRVCGYCDDLDWCCDDDDEACGAWACSECQAKEIGDE